MHIRSIIAAAMLLGILPAGSAWAQSDEENFQAMAAALKANDTERQLAIDTCIGQGIGENPAGAAAFMGVAVEKAASAWCHRITNGIAGGELTLADLLGINAGNISAKAAMVLTTPIAGE